MAILVYGFGPYRHFSDNVTEEILRRIPKRRWLDKVVFPVKFHRRQFIKAIDRFRPAAILGLGQCSRGRLLRIETRAINRRRNRKAEKARAIAPRGAPKLFTDLRLALNHHARRSRHAGDYVCNYSMYVVLDFLRRHELPIRYGFVHVPHDYDPEKAARLLNRALARMAKGGAVC